MGSLFCVTNNSSSLGLIPSIRNGHLSSLDFPEKGLFFLINSLKNWLLIFIDKEIGISDVLELFFVGESQVVPEIFLQIVDQEVILLGLEKSVIVLIQNYDLFTQIVQRVNLLFLQLCNVVYHVVLTKF